MEKITFKNGQAPYINDTNLNKMQDNVEKAIEAKTVSQIRYYGWHSILPIRSDINNLEIMCYGVENLKHGNYSIASDFKIVPILLKDSNSYGEITIPASAVTMTRYDWGFDLFVKRSNVENIKNSMYDGLITLSSNLIIKSR